MIFRYSVDSHNPLFLDLRPFTPYTAYETFPAQGMEMVMVMECAENTCEFME